MWPVTLPGSWVASTKPEAVIARRQGRGLVKGEGGLWRRVIAGQGPGERCRLHHYEEASRGLAPPATIRSYARRTGESGSGT